MVNISLKKTIFLLPHIYNSVLRPSYFSWVRRNTLLLRFQNRTNPNSWFYNTNFPQFTWILESITWINSAYTYNANYDPSKTRFYEQNSSYKVKLILSENVCHSRSIKSSVLKRAPLTPSDKSNFSINWSFNHYSHPIFRIDRPWTRPWSNPDCERPQRVYKLAVKYYLFFDEQCRDNTNKIAL